MSIGDANTLGCQCCHIPLNTLSGFGQFIQGYFFPFNLKSQSVFDPVRVCKLNRGSIWLFQCESIENGGLCIGFAASAQHIEAPINTNNDLPDS